MYGPFRNDFAFLDIETTGLSRAYDKLTVVGVYGSDGYQSFIDGHNMSEAVDYLRTCPMLVTFNGSLFDLPFIREKYPEFPVPLVHLDLRFILRRVGLRGPLKSIEAATGITRDEEVSGLTGHDATVLWSRYVRGDGSALAQLIKYNVEDTVNLKRLMDLAAARLAGSTLPGASGEPMLGDISMPAVSTGEGVVRIDGREIRIRPAPKRRVEIEIGGLLARVPEIGRPPRIVGIDLTGSEERPSGWALLDGMTATTKRVKTDDDLIQLTHAAAPDLVSIDSPLSLPKGRTSVDDDGSSAGITRECERHLKRIGVSVFWCLLPSMRGLTARGIRLASVLRESGLAVIESFPGAAQDILQIPRKKTSLDELREGLSQFGIRGEYEAVAVSHDELDAITCSLVGLFYLADQYEALGNPDEDYLIVPRLG